MTRVKKGDFGEGKVDDSKETKRCTELESADRSPSDGPGEYSAKILIKSALVLGPWRVVDEVKEGEEDPNSTRILMIRL